jgi:carboxymethylenebutenolidase
VRIENGIATIGLAIVCLFTTLSHADETSEARHYGVGNKVETYVFQPQGPRNGKAVLVLHASSGLRDTDLRYAKRLASEGFVAIVPAFMKRYGITESMRRATWQTYSREIYADFLAVIEQSSAEFGVPKDRFYAVGFSNGGYWAAFLAARGTVRAGVAHYGAFSEAGNDPSLSSFRSAFNAKSSPVLILHGNNDQTVAVRFAEELQSIIQRSGSKVEAHFFKDVGHGFERSQQEKPGYREAAVKSFEFTLKFLSEN